MALTIKTRNGHPFNHPHAKVRIEPEYHELKGLKPWQEKVLRGDCRLLVKGSRDEEKLFADEKVREDAEALAAERRKLDAPERKKANEAEAKAKKKARGRR